MTFQELKEALHLFGFHEKDLLTITKIKERHRALVRKVHPDLVTDADPAKIRDLNQAARTIMDYVMSYRFSFSPEEFYRQIPEEHLRHQFENDPVWAGRLEENKK